MKAIVKYLNNRQRAIQVLLNKPRSKYSSGTFHKLRVEIKKLNALLDVVNDSSKSFKRKKIFKPFKQLFRQAGKVRELQVEEAMLKKYVAPHSLNDYITGLRTLLLAEKEIFFSIANKKMSARLKNKHHEIAPYLKALKRKDITSYLEKKITRIKKLINQGALQTEQVHELRKRLKILCYNRKSLCENKQNKLPSKKDALPALLGKWHDLQVILGHLQKITDTGSINAKELIQIEKIKTKISAESGILISRINKAIVKSEFFEASKVQAICAK